MEASKVLNNNNWQIQEHQIDPVYFIALPIFGFDVLKVLIIARKDKPVSSWWVLPEQDSTFDVLPNLPKTLRNLWSFSRPDQVLLRVLNSLLHLVLKVHSRKSIRKISNHLIVVLTGLLSLFPLQFINLERRPLFQVSIEFFKLKQRIRFIVVKVPVSDEYRYRKV